MYINHLLDIIMNTDESVMIVGETGNGKTSLIQDKLRAYCSGDITEVFYITVNTNR
jgi:type IV secretory pathway ATPase VirB11/archaellum biosynthesis ATPase